MKKPKNKARRNRSRKQTSSDSRGRMRRGQNNRNPEAGDTGSGQQGKADGVSRLELFRRMARKHGNRAAARIVKKQTSRKKSKPRKAGSPEEETASVMARLPEGQSLDGSVKQEMERGLGQNVGEVEIHTGEEAAQLAREQQARAFAVGKHIVFGAGEYNPGTLEGDAIIAHELAHVIQQKDATAFAQESESAAEQDADQAVFGLARERFSSIQMAVADFPKLAGARMRSGLRIARCGLIGLGKTPEEKYESVKKALSYAESGFENAHYVLPDADASEKALRVSKTFGQINSALDKVDTAVEIYDFVEAWNDFSENDPSKDPEGFARAAGNFLASTGKIMKRSSIPAISTYGEFLSNAGNFFENMLYGLDPGKKWKDEFEMIEREKGTLVPRD